MGDPDIDPSESCIELDSSSVTSLELFLNFFSFFSRRFIGPGALDPEPE